MPILLYKDDAELAQRVIDFFNSNPDKNLCRVGIGTKEMVVFLRREIPKLTEIASRQLPERQKERKCINYPVDWQGKGKGWYPFW